MREQTITFFTKAHFWYFGIWSFFFSGIVHYACKIIVLYACDQSFDLQV